MTTYPCAETQASDGSITKLSENLQMRAICDAYAGRVFKFLLRLTHGERQLAEDLLQETMVRAWQNLHRLGGDPETALPWLYTVARRVAIDAARARRVRPSEVTIVDDDLPPEVDDFSERVVAIRTIRQSLPLLTAQHREVLIELYFYETTLDELAARLGIPKGTVKSRTYYALRSLHAAIETNQAKSGSPARRRSA